VRKLFTLALLASTLYAQEVFRITPQRPIEQLRREALAAQPPQETGKRKPELVELTTLDPTIKLDIRYATANNFLSTPVYEQARAFLQEPAAKALVKAHRWLKKRGYGLLIHDAYRPWYVTKIFWEATPPDQREFVADPATGSRHNRGAAVDLTLYDVKTGEAVEMPSLYDEFSPRAYPTYAGGTAEQRRLRDLLREAMEKHGFKVIENEWWHFDYKEWREYPILNVALQHAKCRGAKGVVYYISEWLRGYSGPIFELTKPNDEDPVVAPRITNLVDPEYSDEAREKKTQGTVVMSILVGTDGAVHLVRIECGPGRGLDENAAEALRSSRFQPGTRHGHPVPVLTHVETSFRLY
jgi:D-alanyl-D-alanine dipeptidase